MVFSSMVFLWLFLPTVIIGSFVFRGKWQNFFLLIVSLFFYAWGEPVYILLMLISIFVNWLSGILISYCRKKKVVLCGSVILNLLLLGYFKYFDFLLYILNLLFKNADFEYKNIALPIGISFYTFQALSYVIDVYRNDCKVQKNIFDLALYISFFPQLIAGPIVKYKDINEQIECRNITSENFAMGFRRFSYGLGKKVIIANILAETSDRIFAMDITDVTFSLAWLGAAFYTLQIYYDFSGYSDMAIGLGKMMGFDFLENFNYPYTSISIQEFWRRWHISLGTWFREYLYIPLGGNRKGKIRTYVNSGIVFLATGIWHGASFNYLFWGMYHGSFVIIERIGLNKVLKKSTLLSRVYVLMTVICGWVIFRIESVSAGIKYIQRMLMPWRFEIFQDDLAKIIDLRTWTIFLFGLLGCGIIQYYGEKSVFLKKWKYSKVEWIVCSLMVIYACCLLAGDTYNPFIYFRF